jgi:hypothetical protein
MLAKNLVGHDEYMMAAEGRSDMSIIARKLAQNTDMAAWLKEMGIFDGVGYYEANDDVFRQFIYDIYTTSLPDLYTLGKYGLDIQGSGDNIYDVLGVPELLSTLNEVLDDLWKSADSAENITYD